MRKDKGSKRNFRLDRSGSTDAEDIERTMNRLYLTSLEIDVRKGIQFVHDDIDIIRTDSGGKDCHPYALVLSGHGHKLSRSMPELLFLEVFRNHIDSSGISHKNHVVGKFFRTKVQMEDRSVTIDDKF